MVWRRKHAFGGGVTGGSKLNRVHSLVLFLQICGKQKEFFNMLNFPSKSEAKKGIPLK